MRGKDQSTYLLCIHLYIRLTYQYFGYASNEKVVQIFNRIDKINLEEILESIDKIHFSNSEPNNNLDIDTNNGSVFINKTTKFNF